MKIQLLEGDQSKLGVIEIQTNNKKSKIYIDNWNSLNIFDKKHYQ